MNISTPSRSFGYWLRYALPPNAVSKTATADLVKFVKQAKIDEVMFFTRGEEFSPGHLKFSEFEECLAAMRPAKRRLEKLGVPVALNPWSTFYHGDRGRSMRGMGFEPMVMDNGVVSRVTACPLDPRFRRYLARIWELSAREKFTAIWIEDDFRYHNHNGGWGGCFCKRHLEAVSDLLGRRHDRASLLAAITRPGKPSRARLAWMKVNRQGWLLTAEAMRSAVDRVAPQTRLGLMTSNPDVHSIEGRDWDELMDAISGPHHPLIRPGFPPYSEYVNAAHGLRGIYQVLHTRAVLPAGTEACTEIETFAYSRWSRSREALRTQILLSALVGCPKATFNILGFMGQPIELVEPDMAGDLARVKPAALALGRLASGNAAESLRMRGIQILTSADASRHVRTSGRGDLNALNPKSTGWTRALSDHGHALTYEEQPVACLSGKMAWAIDASELRERLARGLLLDGPSASVLLQRGLGRLIGITRGEWEAREVCPIAYEEICDDAFGPRCGRMTANVGDGTEDFLHVRPARGARVISRFLRYDGKPRAPAWLLHENSLGGRVAIWMGTVPANIGLGYMNWTRHAQLGRIVAWLYRGPPPAVIEGGPYLLCLRADAAREILLACVNQANDPVENLEIALSDLPARPRRATRLTPGGTWRSSGVEMRRIRGGVRIRSGRPLATMATEILRVSC